MADTGYRSPSAVADDATAGTNAWSNAGNAAASDNAYATATLSGQTSTTRRLRATGFGLSVPAGATINGIEVQYESKRIAVGAVREHSVRLLKAGTVAGTDATTTTVTIGASDTYRARGGPSALWGTTWTAEEVNASDFGFVVQFRQDGTAPSGEQVLVDHMQLAVYYTEAQPAPMMMLLGVG